MTFRKLSQLLILAFSFTFLMAKPMDDLAVDIDVSHMVIDLRFDWEEKQAIGSTTIELTLLEESQFVYLAAEGLDIQTISKVDCENLTYESESEQLIIDLGKEYHAEDRLAIKIDYQTTEHNDTDPNNIWGSFGHGIRFLEPSTTEPKRQRQIWSVGDPIGNASWFPHHSDPSDLSTVEMLLRVQKPLRAIANGQLKSTIDNQDGTRTYLWVTEKPHAAHLTSFVVGKYLDVTQEHSQVKIYNYCYPHEADATAATVVRLPDMMDFYDRVTGVPYPYDDYSQVFVQEFGGWMGNNTYATITENMVDDYVTHKDFRFLWDLTESEALASQWFGSHISPTSWKDAWLSRALPRHMAGLYNEFKNGRDEYLAYQLAPQQSTYLNDWNNGIHLPVATGNYDDPTTFVRGNQPYLHGASVIHTLRHELDDEQWFAAMQDFTKTYGGKTATTEDFQSSIENTTGKDLDWFFNQWFDQVGHPIFELSSTYDDRKKEVVLSVKQVQQWDTLDTQHLTNQLFKGSMTVEVGSAIHEIEIQTQREMKFSFEADQKPSFINFDFENAWVKEVRFDQSLDAWINQYLYSKDILARTQAMTQLGMLANQSGISKNDRSSIMSAFQGVISSEDTYWRLKMTSLWQLQSMMLDADGSIQLDEATEEMLLSAIKNEESWVKSSAIWFLGMSKDPKYAQLYIDAFNDWSDRVTNAAAIALGKTGHESAYGALIELQHKPSWKNQSLISSLNGLQQLADPRAVDLTLAALTNSEAAHWTLATPIWDHRLAAANTLFALGKSKEGLDLILPQLKAALAEEDINDVFYNLLQVVTLGNPEGLEAFSLARKKFEGDEEILLVIERMEGQFKSALQQ
ncbi:MAG: M1 family aminopeptidase [Bacteroidota bacterium]